jgi:cytochrome P450
LTVRPASGQAHEIDDALASPAFFADPHPIYRRMRTECPVFWSERLGRWIVTRYEDVAAGLRSRDLSNAGRSARLLREPSVGNCHVVDQLTRHFGAGLLYSDPPRHTEIRKLLSGAFTAEAVDRLRPLVESIVRERLDDAELAGRIDVVADLALPLAISVMGTIVGVPAEDRGWIKDCCDEISRFSGGQVHAATSASVGLRAVYAFLEQAFDAPRTPGDLFELLLQADGRGRRLLDDQEIRSTAVTMLIAGYETTVRLIGNGAVALLAHPDQLEAFRGRPELAPQAVEEILRFDGPFDWILRRVKGAASIGTVDVGPDDLVALSLVSANRDPARFAAADTFDITRPPQRHVAFGSGLHFCLGAPIARMEAEVALTELFRRFPGIGLVGPAPVTWREDHAIRGVESVRVDVSAHRDVSIAHVNRPGEAPIVREARASSNASAEREKETDR